MDATEGSLMDFSMFSLGELRNSERIGRLDLCSDEKHEITVIPAVIGRMPKPAKKVLVRESIYNI